MSIFSFFSNTVAGDNKSHLKNLISVAMSDGNMDENEAKALLSVAMRLNINEGDVRQMVTNYRDIRFVLPKERKNRIQQFWDIIMIILADGKIEEHEMKIFENFATKLGIRKAIIAGLIRKFTEWTDKKEPLNTFK